MCSFKQKKLHIVNERDQTFRVKKINKIKNFILKKSSKVCIASKEQREDGDSALVEKV